MILPMAFFAMSIFRVCELAIEINRNTDITCCYPRRVRGHACAHADTSARYSDADAHPHVDSHSDSPDRYTSAADPDSHSTTDQYTRSHAHVRA